MSRRIALVLISLAFASCERSRPEPTQSVVALHANVEFTTALLAQMAPDERGNAVLSPHGLSHTLGLLAVGATGATRDELTQALRRPLDAKPVFSRTVDWSSRTRAWSRDGVVIKDEFARTASDVFQCTISAGLDASAARAWAARDLEPASDVAIDWSVPLDATLRIVNVSRFGGAWREPFHREATKPKPFRRASGETVDVPTMSGKPHCGYFADDDWHVVRLHYADADVCALILLPVANEPPLTALARTGEKPIEAALALSGERAIELEMPRFELSAFIHPRESLAKLGVVRAWSSETAEFDGISDTKMWLLSIQQAVALRVDEAGTRAEAETEVLMGLGYSSDEGATIVRVDHPFLFLVVHRPARAILFAAVVGDPLETSLSAR